MTVCTAKTSHVLQKKFHKKLISDVMCIVRPKESFTKDHRSLKFNQSNRKKEALRMIVSIYNI